MSDDRIRARAARAAAELSETEAAFEAMRENAIAAWAATADAESAHRESLYRAVKVIDAVRDHLLQRVQDGEVVAFAQRMREV